MATGEIDATKAEEFAGRMVGVVNDGVLCVLASIGHQTGLFDAMAGLPPSTSEEIADAAGLDERYVREWLGAITVGRIVDYEPDGGTYVLPPERAACLTRAAGPDNLALVARLVSLSGQVEGPVIDCFRNGGGLPYSAYPGFHEFQAEFTAGAFDAALVDRVVPLVPGLRERLEEGIDVLDVGCGAGHAINLLARALPASRYTGYDLSEEAVALAGAEAAELGLSNARFEPRAVDDVDETDSYDLVTAFDVIHDLPHPGAALAAIARVLRPGGRFLMVDIAASSHLQNNLDHPLGPIIYGGSVMHCVPVSLGQGGEGLGTAWGEERARDLLAEAGFDRVEVTQVEGDPFNNYFVASLG
ncbi:MAG: class I SAM-dependent methyltransferase [Solirubrobacteraceae bacterium]